MFRGVSERPLIGDESHRRVVHGYLLILQGQFLYAITREGEVIVFGFNFQSEESFIPRNKILPRRVNASEVL